MKRFQNYEFFPLLIAIYPVLALLGHNIEEVKPVVALRPMIVLLLVAILLLMLLSKLVRSKSKAAILLAFSLLLIFSYGHVYDLLRQTSLANLTLGRHRVLAPIWTVVFTLGTIWILKRKTDFSGWIVPLNLITLVVLCFPMFQILQYYYREVTLPKELSVSDNQFSYLHLPANQPPPDIYYIILDAYGRQDILQEMYELDNSAFLNELERMGFYVATCSRSNYAQTQLSLASSLNMEYIQNLSDEYVPGHFTRVGLDDLIRHSLTRRALESLGYKTIAFETGFKYTQIEDADLYLSPKADLLSRLQFGGGLTAFEVLLVKTSLGRLISDGALMLPATLMPALNYPEKEHRDLVLFDLEQLGKLPTTPGPKFVFVHIVMPHPPYVFEADGSFSPPDKDDFSGYRDQVIYINSRLLTLLPEIIAKSTVPPVIILQGDHGPILAAPKHRLKILNAYFLPDNAAKQLYPTISPVNTFRLIFDAYFGEYNLLEDRSYFSTYQAPFNFIEEAETQPACKGK